jgi:hypothetical protein
LKEKVIGRREPPVTVMAWWNEVFVIPKRALENCRQILSAEERIGHTVILEHDNHTMGS